MNPISLGVLEDDPDQSELLDLWLTEAGYDVLVYSTGPEFVRAARAQGFDLILLDWIIPEMSGYEVLEWVRSNMRENVPVLFLTARNEEKHIVKALKAGADDYVIKPPKHDELLARVGALARRGGLTDAPPDRLTVGEFSLDRQLGQVIKDGTEVRLTQREFDLVWVLFNNVAKILSRDYLLRHVWNISARVSTRTVDTHVSRVRSKLGLQPENGWQLSSVYHYGYRLEQLNSEGAQRDD